MFGFNNRKLVEYDAAMLVATTVEFAALVGEVLMGRRQDIELNPAERVGIVMEVLVFSASVVHFHYVLVAKDHSVCGKVLARFHAQLSTEYPKIFPDLPVSIPQFAERYSKAFVARYETDYMKLLVQFFSDANGSAARASTERLLTLLGAFSGLEVPVEDLGAVVNQLVLRILTARSLILAVVKNK